MSVTTASDGRVGPAALHSRESEIVVRLNTILDSRKDVNRELSILDELRPTLSTQLITSRDIQRTMLASTADMANRLSTRVNELETERKRVQETLRMVEQVIELKECLAGAVGSMGAPQDWEAAAHYIYRASRIPDDVLRGDFAAVVVPSIEIPDPPWITLQTAKESLCALFLRQFESAVKDENSAKLTRFFKLFPLIGKSEVGLDAYGRYICLGVARAARETLKKADFNSKDPFSYANCFTKLFEHIAQIVDSHSGLVTQHYGAGQMVKVIEKLQAEADVQGGIILDAWTDSRAVERVLSDIRSYPFVFLARSMLTGRQGLAVETDDDHTSVDVRVMDELLSEMTAMLERWSFYSRFIARQCQDADVPESASLIMPGFLVSCNLSRKVSEKLSTLYGIMTAFFIRRSVEQAFQMDAAPTGLSLTKPTSGQPPFIMQAIDDVMYVVDIVLQKVISTSNHAVAASAIPDTGRVLESDLIGIIHKRMRDECHPRSTVEGSLAPEDKIVKFIVMINSLDISVEYLDRLIRARAGLEGVQKHRQQKSPSLKDRFPCNGEAQKVALALERMNKAFSSKATPLLNEGIEVLLNEVVRLGLRQILANSFRDVQYDKYSGDEAVELSEHDGMDGPLPQASERFEEGWNHLMTPLSRIMTPKTYHALLALAAKLVARDLEKRLWSFSGHVSEFGAVTMERDFAGMVDVICKDNYGLRGVFAKTQQVCMVANIDDDEWAETMKEGERCDFDWVLTQEEMKRARQIVGP
ncbi:hypothetical protein AK830_g1355 [Neonectria ditissima]|uniref:Conserved oligomeric Golgi complex subunit 4 n=1 Tax=Neonectria ditissima TaxID=78410 RepID=A0A0P7BZY4_9HYPO|nr:hypothetical protein AK830_g1355 [Neonectria ditissima]